MKTHINKSKERFIFLLFLCFFSFTITPLSASQLTIKKVKNVHTLKEDFVVRITKKTTPEELQHIKKQMMIEGLEFHYSNLIYNDAEEIVSISIKYRDTNNNQGNYKVSSETPINTILISSSGNQISVKSEGSGNQASISQRNNNEISQDNKKTGEKHSAAFEKRRIELDKKMEDRMRIMEERRTQIQNQQKTERDNNFDDQKLNFSAKFNGEYKIVTKNASNSDLHKLKKSYELENILFSYNQLERNTQGLITHITITLNNRNGAISTSSFGNAKDAIKDISIGVDRHHSIMKTIE